MRRARLAVVLCLLALPAAPAAGSLVVGIGDQQPQSFADARLRALGMSHARLIVPWDAATSEPDSVQAWLSAVAAAGMTPHVAFEHLRSDHCPGRPCVLPTRAQYGAAVRAFIARFPQVRTYTAWNEANHASQPVAQHPEAAAGFYEELRAACPACTIVAGDVLDSGSYVRWLERFQAATSSDPRLWGLHNYGDVTYGRTTGTDAVLRTVRGTLWIEETGGLVTLRNSAGVVTLPTDEQRARAAIDRAFAIAAARPRIARMYIFHWRADPLGRFDAGLVRPDGSARPSLAALASDLAALRPAAAWSARWSHGWLLVRVRCSVATCRGRVSAKVRRPSLGTRSYRTTAAHPSRTLRFRVRRRAARVRLTVRPTVPAGAATRVVLAIGRS
jgi:hypothetical protein